MTSLPGDPGAFALDQRGVMTTATVKAAPWLDISAGAGMLNARTADAKAVGAIPINARFTPANAAGLGTDHNFLVTSMGAVADVRDVPGNPRRGGRYAIAARRYAATPQQPYSFTQVDGEIEQHVSFWKRQRLITLRAFASTALTSEGQAVPFYLQPTLGGSRLMRGFVTDRFRDRSLLALQAEYGWDLSPFINAVLYYETGAVGATLRGITAKDFRRDYGIGFRFGAVRTVAIRTDVAFGSGEGVRVTMRFNHAF
jgi:outer membrane protein assembly factor BamA